MKPNLLFVFADQHRKFDLGCYGNTVIQTPHLDALAKEGMRFEHYISNCPLCVPARGSMLTGLMPQKHGAFTNDMPIRYTVTGVADVLRAGGYHTGYIGKWHLCGIPRDQTINAGRRLGFETWKVANCNHDYLSCYYDDEENVRHRVPGYEPEIFGGLAADFLRSRAENKQPWALYLSFATPHDPFDRVGENYRALYEQTDIPLRPNAAEPILCTKEKSITLREEQQKAKGYYRHITAIDDQFGRLMEILRKTGQLENTIVVYTSDHGEMLGSQGQQDKQLPYEESIGVPLLIRWPGRVPGGTVSKALLGVTDLPVSLLSLMGLHFPQEVDGRDLSGVFTDPTAAGAESCYLFDLFACHQAYCKGMPAWRGIRTARYTYAVTADNPDWLLFDNENDPYQQHNLANDSGCTDVKAELAAQLREYIERYDALLSGENYIRFCGATDTFNNSQAYFNYPLIR